VSRTPRERIAAEVAKAEDALLEAKRIGHGWVTAIDPDAVTPTTIQLGPGTHPAYAIDGVSYAVGDPVAVMHTGTVYVIVGKINLAHQGVVAETGLVAGRFYRNTTQSINNNITAPEEQVLLNATQGTSAVGSISGGGVLLSVSGMFLIGAGIAWDANATGFRWLSIQADGAELVNDTTGNAGSAIATVQGCSIWTQRTAGELITMHARQNSGAALASQGSTYAGRLATRLWIVRLGP
jgi:hypothetical protein